MKPAPERPVPLLAVRRLQVRYPLTGSGWRRWQRAGELRALDGVDFDLMPGEALGIVGESGCGKSTLARVLAGLQKPDAGAAEYQGRNLTALDEAGWRPLRRDIQLVFQDALASLDPRMNVASIVAEPLKALYPELGAQARAQRVAESLQRVGLPVELLNRYPHQLSGGQGQRVGIARALAVRPRVLICDEPVSALDVSVQAQIVNLLMQLRREDGLTLVFIAHDLAVVRQLCDRVLVMLGGRVMEQASSDVLFRLPAHPYTRALLAAVPSIEAEAGAQPELLSGDAAGVLEPTQGCVFVSRCAMADERCARSAPHLRRVAHGGHAACHYIGLAADAA